MDQTRRIVLALGMFFLPVEYLALFDFGALPITPTKFSGLLMILFGGLQWLAGPRSFPWSTKHVWVAAFAFSFLVSNVVTVIWGVPLVTVVPYITTDISLLVLYFLMPLLVRSVRDVDWLASGFVLGCVFVGASALLGYGFRAESEISTRVGGLGGNPNGTAQNLGVALPLLLYFIFSASRLWRRATAMGMLALVVVAALATLSRAFFLSLPVMWAFALFRFRRADLLRFTAIGLVILSLGVPFLPATVWERIGTLESAELARDGSAQSRLAQIQVGTVAFVKSPIVGVGRRNFMNWARFEEGIPIANTIHNIYLGVAAEQGLVGIVSFMGMLVLAWNEFSRAWRMLGQGAASRSSEARRLRLRVLAFQTAFVGILFGGLFHPMLNFKPMWVILGLSTVLVRFASQTVTVLTRDPTRISEETLASGPSTLVTWAPGGIR